MARKNDSINVSIFTALKVSEISKVPVLIISNPGIGKSTTVELFAKVRGYELVLLRGNSTTSEEIMGYDTVPSDLKRDEKAGARHLRPSWFDKLMKNQADGKKSLLFLDELTTANEFVQASLLHLVFERMCGDEKLPDDTLIVAAGNYAQNLSNTMTVLPPMMNRFMIFNIVPKSDDLDTFLCEFEGAIASPTGECKDFMKELQTTFQQMDAQEVTLTMDKYNRIGEYIENGIKSTARRLWTHDRVLDMSVTELNNIYSDTDHDAMLYGFISFRTLVYLKRITLAFFKCFGKDGIMSKNYLNAVNGLVGLAISRDSSNGEVKSTKVGNEFFNDMKQIVTEIAKMENTKLPEYQTFFVNIINDPSTSKSKDRLTIPEIQAITNKAEELKKDHSVSGIERPIDSVVVNQLFDLLLESSKEACGAKAKTSVGTKIPTETIAGWATAWNQISMCACALNSIANDPTRGYKEDVTSKVRSTINELNRVLNRLRTIKRAAVTDDPETSALIPEIEVIK